MGSSRLNSGYFTSGGDPLSSENPPKFIKWRAMDATLRDDVRTLTTWLGRIIREQEGEAFFTKLERLRQLAKTTRTRPGASR